MSHVTESADDRLDDSSFRHTHHRLAAVPRTHGESIFVTLRAISADSAESLRFLDVTKIPSRTSITSM